MLLRLSRLSTCCKSRQSQTNFLRLITTREVDEVTKQLLIGKDFAPELDTHLTTNIGFMDATNIANIIFLSSKHGRVLSANHLNMLGKRISQKSVILNKLVFSKMIYGFRNQCESQDHVKKFLKILTKKVFSSSNRVVLDGQGVGNCLYGLQRMTCESDEVKGLVKELMHHVQHCTSQLKSQEVGNALYGLQNMSSAHREVRGLLLALARRVSGCNEALSAQAIGNSLYGLKNMDSTCLEVCFTSVTIQ